MKSPLKIVSFAGLATLLAAAILVFAGRIGRHAYTALALAGTVAWFGTVPFWMRRRLHHSEE